MKNGKIDFVITWVDGNDPEWRASKNKFKGIRETENGVTENRFRDWNLLKFWFRSVEKYAPWVNRIYLVTCGHYPEWMNLESPKLTLVKHSDYIPQEYLPTFNSNVIELFMHRIPGLSENFVLFNDDMYLTTDTTEKDFFRNGLPCESAILGTVTSADLSDVFPHTLINNIAAINREFNKKEVLKKNAGKYFTPVYGKYLMNNILLAPFVNFSGFRDFHVATSYRKENFESAWKVLNDEFLETATHRFRASEDLTHWLIKWRMLYEGQFVPRKTTWGKCFEIGEVPTETIIKALKDKKYKMVCLNDSSMQTDFEHTQKQLEDTFAELLPDKSSYEK